MKKALSQIVLALACSAVVAWLLLGVNATWAQDATEPAAEVTTEPVVVPDAPVIVINAPTAEPAPESTANQLYTVIIVALSALGIVVTVVKGIQNKVPVTQVDQDTAVRIDTYHLEHISTLEKQVDALTTGNKELLRNLAAALEAISKFTPIKADDRLSDLAKDATDGTPSTFGKDAVG